MVKQIINKFLFAKWKHLYEMYPASKVAVAHACFTDLLYVLQMAGTEIDLYAGVGELDPDLNQVF